MEWKITAGLTQYPEALATMAARVAAIQRAEADDLVWLVEHPPLYTLGSSAKTSDVLDKFPLPVYKTGRGGQVTYHGPGQRVVYVMRDLKNQRKSTASPDLRAYVRDLEAWVILTLAQFGVDGFRREGRAGVWVDKCTAEGDGEAKIAALGVRVQKWVTSHGIALNVNPDLAHYAGIVPCGISEFGITSLHALGVKADMAEIDTALRQKFDAVF